MSWLKNLNPATWIKRSIAGAIDEEIDKWITPQAATEGVNDALNYAIAMSEARIDDAKMMGYARALEYVGLSLIEAAHAIEPNGEEGRRISKNEMGALMARSEVLFGEIIAERKFDEVREAAKVAVRKILKLED